MNVENTDQLSQQFCGNCKSFFGNEAYDWLCSGCYTNQKKTVESIKLIRKISDTCTEIPDSLETKEVPSLALNQIDKSKCFQCSKKVGLLGIDCRCSMTFCNLHRMPEDHSCTVDYRKLGREKLLKENKKVVASKINQI